MSTYVTKRAAELGVPMVEAKRPLMLEVTEGDSNKGAAKNSKECAFAIACKRQVPGVRKAHFFRGVAWLEYPDKLVRFILPPSMQKEIVAFDRGAFVAPGTYRLVRPSPTLTLAAMEKRNKENGKKATRSKGKDAPAKKKGKKKFSHRTANVRSLYEPRDRRID